MSYIKPGSLLIGLIIPFVGVLGGVAILSQSGLSIAGIPILYFWIFIWFVLTSLCLATSWYFFDAGDYEYEEGSEIPREEEERV